MCNKDINAERIKKSGEFDEPSPERLIDLMKRIPFEGDDWEQDLDTLVVPLTLDQYWDAFWATDAPYYIEAIPLDPEDELHDNTGWGEPSPGFETELGKTVIQERRLDRTLRLRGNPLARHVHNVVYLSLIERTDTRITLKLTYMSDGQPFADRVQPWVKWDVMTTDPRSHQVAAR